MKAPLGVILAGGESRRMGGGDKCLTHLGDVPLLTHVIERLSPQVADISLNANGDATRFSAFGLHVIGDTIVGYAGPLAGVLAGLDWAAEQGADHIVTAAADTPFFPADIVPRLLLASEIENLPIAMAATPNEAGKVMLHPVFGLWPVALREDLRAALKGGVRKVILWADTHGVAKAVFPTTPFDPFFNVNTPEDLAQARAFLAAGA
ncbi:molybdenum cofactor guanylyltransferase MobA [Falsihalocynthiibacter arcticus]|uniref:Molybdenum cofactor guanylyltransferase n=1 Tax=Falsihalocynthiibacter arcticus TaxID=1579316 RepID=A0A126UYR8_9RHOB|nr:molybdenum cofactor guanylyltransferase MobA [Falsihalocynthiibacter arcticus]AML51218.1 molybdenum cofactor guanylyltransferase [Falsihalocynthiibacter arcticus]